ncbi:helix-turn-helix domain-containing protein [Nocardia terpenica]|uniref:helix-turn-helix domain-containing protein n=1 Tax=Nocardia terpenica TaxID=455432 RepID=UPI0018944F75|nr:helix-turn-helix domain-containing protein [Nocardia terpenica]MBF6062489.1 helix-turn-helix domain-containing protein [Nocardia terpenica]MBF6104577.1 helix-turn-helix domain-containing protein [Nocardia terpenica]MBF6109568.1 helix-turn-helix domain-containing protein [Nocardia terpenica]MBF6119873.1 helix-turn-helix domain-containing protein [Nocardia terpenica]MBF6152284.1 helix-turn-helix domain-containing protein [Nocardia terpenica]
MSTVQARLHRIAGVCERLGVGRSTVFELIRTGELVSVKVGRRRLVSEQAIADYIDRITSGGPHAA